jgi:signal recognition particle receptor subunit beta
MVQFNLRQKELTLKVVYYGPGLSGKTTNLQALHKMAPQQSVGRLMTLETRDDRTLFFDLLPMSLQTGNGYRVKIKLFTVPGQAIHKSTRRIVLQGADAVVFVADSQISETEANKQSYGDLLRNLEANGLSIQMPLVVQFNKRDLPEVRSDLEIEAFRQRRNHPVVPAIAIDGIGVKETLEAVLEQVWDHLEKTYGISEKLRMNHDDFMGGFFVGWSSVGAPQ